MSERGSRAGQQQASKPAKQVIDCGCRRCNGKCRQRMQVQEFSGNRPMADGRWFKCLAITLATGPLGVLTLVGGSEIRRGRRNWRMHVQVSDRVATCKEEWVTTTPFFRLAGELADKGPEQRDEARGVTTRPSESSQQQHARDMCWVKRE